MRESVITQSNPDLSDNMKQSNDKNSRYCTRCTRALKACLCDYIVPVDNHTPLYILQHPNEVAHPKGTAALLAASLQQCEIHVGRTFPAMSGSMGCLQILPVAAIYSGRMRMPFR